MTGAIIDLNIVQGTRCSFERVNWTISHRNTEVRDFVVRRLNHWTQQTQIACDMAYDDAVFLQEQREKQVKKAPPITSANFGRRYRTRSLTSSTTNFHSRHENIPTTPSTSTYKRDTPFTGLLARTLLNIDPRSNDRTRLFPPRTDEVDMNQLIETAKWAGVLSDTSDNELNENRVCFADTVSLSKLAEMLRNNELQPTSDICDIDTVIQQSTMNVTSREQIRQFDGKSYWFHRVILDNHIQFPVGISQDANEARRLAYRHMLDVCLNKGGVKMKMLTDNRVKVVKGEQIRQNNDDLDMNATYISMADLSCLSHCKMVY